MSSADGVPEGKESSDCSEHGGDVKVLDCGDGGIVPLNSPGN